jgi:hypothetical protein
MILAAIQAGTIEFSCQACESDPGVKESLGCEEPAQVVVWETEDDQFFSCPVSFISPAIWDWYSEQAYYKEYGAAVPYDKQPALWLDAWSIYNQYYGQFMQAKMKKSEDSTSKGLSALQNANKRGLE